jgi:O-antigen ligase
MLPFTTALFALAYLVGCIGTLRYPIIGIIAYLMIYFTYPEMAWWSQPVAWMGQRYCFVLSAFLGVGFFLNWNRGKWGRSFWHSQEFLFLALVGIMWISTVTGVAPCTTSQKHLDKMTKVAIFLMLTTHIVTDLRSYRLTVWALIIGTLYLGYSSFTAGPSSFVDGRLNNVGGPDFDRAPELGVHFVAMLPLIGTAFIASRRYVTQGLLVVTAGLAMNGLVLTRTRSAMTALIAGMLWAVVTVPRRWRGRLIGIGFVGLIGAYSLTDDGFWERMATIPSTIVAESGEVRNEQGVVITAGRIPTWKAAWAMWLDYPLGVGIGNFTRMIANYPPANFEIDAHNTFVLCFGELGIFGIALFLVIIVRTFSSIRSLRRTIAKHPELKDVGFSLFGLETAIITFMVGGLTVSRFYCEMFWFVMMLPVCLERALANELAYPAARTEPASASSPLELHPSVLPAT